MECLITRAQYGVDIVPPQAASLIKYVQHPVNYSLGLAEITIPLYELEIDGQTLPISLSYHHGGLKAGEFNRQLGQGWTLNAELAVVRNINGKRESVNKFMPADSDSPIRQTAGYLWELASNGDSPFQDTYDEDPDDFFYKLLGRSGLFVFKKEHDGLHACPIPYYPVIITPKNGDPDQGFDITDDHGVRYSFEPTADYYYENSKYPDRKKIQTAWKCVSLQNAAGTESIQFTFGNTESLKYNLNSYTVIEDLPPDHNDWNPNSGKPISWLQPSMFTYGMNDTFERFYWGKELTGSDNNHDGVLDDFYYLFKKDETYSPSHWPRLPEHISTTYHTVIRQIKFTGGRVEFIYDNFDHNLIEDLDEIVVYDHANEQVKRFVFHNHYTKETGNRPQGYYVPSYPMLDSLSVYGRNNDRAEETYRFAYHGDAYLGMPDPWGYITEMPGSILNSPAPLPYSCIDIFYRDERLEYASTCNMYYYLKSSTPTRLSATSQQGLLRSISNSLGGKAEFTYEPNYCTVTELEFPCATYLGENVLAHCDISNPQTTKVQEASGLRIREIVYSDPVSNTKTTRTFKYGKKKQDGSLSVRIHPEDEEDGLGVARRNIDPLSWSTNQKKVYTRLDGSGHAVEEREERFRVFYSQLYGHTPFNRQPVLYKYVTEYLETERDGELMDNGKTVYVYNIPDQPSDDFVAGLYNDATTYYDYKNDYLGIQLLSRTDYKQAGGTYVKQRSSTYAYKTHTVDQVPVGRVFQKIVFDGEAGAQPPQDAHWPTYCNYSLQDIFLHYTYHIPVGTSLLTQRRDSVFPEQGGKPLVDIYEYDYKNPLHLYLTESRHIDSRGRSYKQRLSYPQDSIKSLTDGHAEAAMALRERNMVACLLGEVYNTQEHAWGTYWQYRLFDGFPRFSEQIMAHNGTVATRLQCHAYNAHGRPAWQSRQEGVDDVVYLWGYRNQYPVAKIEGATYEEIRGLLGEAFIESLAEADEPTSRDWQAIGQLRDKLAAASVSTYTYKPLVGMTSITDPRGITTYYAYDDFGRLAETYIVEDGRKKEVETYSYHYAN